MILILAVLLGLCAGLIRAWVHRRPYNIPPIRLVGVLVLAFLAQALAFQIPAARNLIPEGLIPIVQIFSLGLLLLFALLNLRLPGFILLGAGLLCNLSVIAANGGWMPITPQTADELTSSSPTLSWQAGQRFGTSKDKVIDKQDIHLEGLSDRFLLPDRIPIRAAFSIGDVLIALGAWFLLWSIGAPTAPDNLNLSIRRSQW